MGSSQGHELSKKGAEMRGIKFALPCNGGLFLFNTMTEEKIIIRDLRRKEKFVIDDEYLKRLRKNLRDFRNGSLRKPLPARRQRTESLPQHKKNGGGAGNQRKFGEART